MAQRGWVLLSVCGRWPPLGVPRFRSQTGPATGLRRVRRSTRACRDVSRNHPVLGVLIQVMPLPGRWAVGNLSGQGCGASWLDWLGVAFGVVALVSGIGAVAATAELASSALGFTSFFAGAVATGLDGPKCLGGGDPDTPVA